MNLKGHGAFLDPIDFGIADIVDVALAKQALEALGAVADAGKAHVADIGFRRDEGYLCLVADAALAQVVVQKEGKLISRAKA